MKVLMAFTIGIFLSAASPRARRALSKPLVFAAICFAVAASFYSLKVSG